MTIHLGDPIRRDRWGRPYIIPEGGGDPIPYTRVTTVAKTLDSGDGLLPWKATLAVVGTKLRPGIDADWTALIAETGGNPWYASSETKARCKQLVEESAAAGGADDRSRLGTALHKITELADRGLLVDDGQLEPVMRADVAAYVAGIEAHGITYDLIEQLVVHDGYRLAGTPDRVGVHDGVRKIVDLKTGATLDYSWQSIAVQLAVYATARSYDPMTGARGDLNVDLEEALVIHLPAGEASCTVYRVDITAGIEALEHSLWVRGWRGRRNLADRVVLPLGNPLGLQTSAEKSAAKLARRSVTAEGWVRPEDGPSVDPDDDAALSAAIAALPAAVRTQCVTWSRAAEQAGRPLRPGGGVRSLRAVLVSEAMIGAAQLVDRDGADSDVLRLWFATVDCPTPGDDPAIWFASATTDEANRLRTVFTDAATGRVTLTFTDDGTPVATPSKETAS